jgi:hypothetical protein
MLAPREGNYTSSRPCRLLKASLGTTSGSHSLLHMVRLLVVAIAVIGLAVVVLEIRVVACLLRRDATSRVVHQHHLQQVQPCFIKVAAQWRMGVANPLGEGRLEVGISRNTGPDVLGRCAK